MSPRQLSAKEVKDVFIREVWYAVRATETPYEAAYQIMRLLDGYYHKVKDLPARYALVPGETVDEAAERITKGKDYYAECPPLESDITGSLSDSLLLKKEAEKYTPMPGQQSEIKSYQKAIEFKTVGPDGKGKHLGYSEGMKYMDSKLHIYGSTPSPHLPSYFQDSYKKMEDRPVRRFCFEFTVSNFALHSLKDSGNSFIASRIKDAAYKLAESMLEKKAFEVISTLNNYAGTTTYAVMIAVPCPP
jgi:hypothetical protein